MQSPVFTGALPTVLLSGRGLFQQPKPSDPPPPQPPESDGSEEGGYPWENLSVVGRNGLGAVGPEGGDVRLGDQAAVETPNDLAGGREGVIVRVRIVDLDPAALGRGEAIAQEQPPYTGAS